MPDHRNLGNRTSMVAEALQIFFLGKEHPVKYLLISTLPRLGNLLQRNNFQGSTKTSLHFTT
jgi:hypothetical protein